MSFLRIPSQESLFTTVKVGKSADASESRFRRVDDNEEDEDDEEDTDDVRLIPRCSPVPRRRGSSIADETAEYMRIQLALSEGKRVSFADTTGGDLVDVKEFIAFDSDDEDSTTWEEEQAKYREAQGEANYHVHLEFSVPSDSSALLQAVRTNKVEVEQVSPVENEPLAFCGVIRVLNLSFNKAVYIRYTMDNWASYYDHPAEYIQGSHEGDTDKFIFKLCFSPPYTTHGSRIEFVVRYETSEGDYWANNSHMNYVLTLLLSYEDNSPQDTRHVDSRDVKSILKPPKLCSAEIDLESEDGQNKEGGQEGSIQSELVRPTAACPVIPHPDLDLEIAGHPSAPTVQPNGGLPSVDGALSTHCESTRYPGTSSSSPLQNDLPIVLNASEIIQPTNGFELTNQSSEQHEISSPSAQLPSSCPSLSQVSMLSPGWSQATEDSVTGTNILPTREYGSVQSPDSTPAYPVRASQRSEVCEGWSEGPTISAAHCSVPFIWDVALSQKALGARGETQASLQKNDSESADVTEMCQSCDTQTASACKERKHKCKTSPDVFLDNPPGLSSVHDINRSLRPSIIFLSALVSVSVVLQEPSALFVIGLFLILHHL